MVEHSFEKDGMTKVVAKRGFILSTGIDRFYGEMVGDAARNSAGTQYDLDVLHAMQGSIIVREYTDKEGAKRYANEVRITKLI